MFTTRTTALIACTTIALLGLTFPVSGEENSPIPARETNAAIARAIAKGAKGKNNHHGLTLRDSGQGWLNGLAAAGAAMNAANGIYTPAQTKSGLWVEVFTPLAFIAQTAATATREYRPFTPEDVTNDMLEPVVRVIAHPDTPDMVTALGAAGTRSVAHVVMQNEKRGVTIQPTSMERFDVEAKNAMGGELTYTGLSLTFALADVQTLRAEGEFFIVVVGTAGEKRFKVKRKHFDELPL
jgi:hypothetical protein